MQRSLPRPCSALLALALPVSLSSPLSAQTTWHVDSAAAPGGDGSSWSTAFDSLQSALDVAQPADPIWVAAGTYHPTERANPSNPRSARFPLDGAYHLYGGFRGTEASLDERDASLFSETVLSADIGVVGDPSDNTYRVIELSTFAVSDVAHIDGFRITGGNAIGNGGAILAKLTTGGFNPRAKLLHCTIDDNRAEKGGAIAVENFGVVQLVDCVVERNTSATQGGAVYSVAGGCQAVATRFAENVAGSAGGVIFADASHAGWNQFADCLFTANRANRGAVAYLRGSDFTSGIVDWYNCTLWGNEALVSGGAVYAVTDTPTAATARCYNSIVWGNVAPTDPALFGDGLDVRFSDVQAGHVGTGNVDLDPHLLPDGRVRPGSPVDDAGSNGLVVNDFLDLDDDGDTAEPLPLDVLGEQRRRDDAFALDTGAGTAPVVDMGAYETTGFRRRL